MSSIAYDGARLMLSGKALNDVVVTDHARRGGLTQQQLMQANNPTSFGIIVGQQLIIPLP